MTGVPFLIPPQEKIEFYNLQYRNWVKSHSHKKILLDHVSDLIVDSILSLHI